MALVLPCTDPAGFSFDPETHTYRDLETGIVPPSVTAVVGSLGVYAQYDGMPSAARAAVLARGRYVHTAMHYLCEGDLDRSTLDPRFAGYIDSALPYLDDVASPLRDPKGRSIAVEWRFLHRRRMFAGTVDLLSFNRDGELVLTDWKTGEPDDLACSIQTAGYEIGVRACLLPTLEYIGPIHRRAVKLFADGRPARVEPYTDPRDLAVFYAALTCLHFRRNHCRHAEVA